MNRIKSIIKKLIPLSWIKKYKKFILRKELRNQREQYAQKVEILKSKSTISVVFFLINADTWKYHELYQLLNRSELFKPIVIICPLINKGEDYLENNYVECVKLCEKMDYRYMHGYNVEQKYTINVRNKIDFDIVFFSNPNNLTTEEFTFSSVKDTLTCYMPYSFRIDTLYEYGYNKPILNFMWRNFYETEIHKRLAQKYAINDGENVVVSGFPKIDELRNASKISSVWKNQHKKKIVWAPHWTIKGYQNAGINWACFLDYCEVILDIAIKYSEKIEIALKPHPFLFNILEKEELWGKAKTEQYFGKWGKNGNTHIVQGDYVDLFASSDALIHDSGSFTVEYLVFNKPVAYTASKDNKLNERFNEFGKMAVDQHYIVYNKRELNNFFLQVIDGTDPMKESRKEFVESYLNGNGLSAAEKILEELNKKLI